MRSATLAVVFTVGVFLAMGQLVSVDENIVALKSAEVEIRNVVAESSLKGPAQTMIVRPEIIALEPAPSHLSRDQILMSFELSDTEVLMAEFSFEFSQNPETTQNNVEVAMVDIHSLIQIGELEGARQRYSHLKMECGGCGLPDTLEALVLAAQVMATKHSNMLETG
jgi:hypothetical protein